MRESQTAANKQVKHVLHSGTLAHVTLLRHRRMSRYSRRFCGAASVQHTNNKIYRLNNFSKEFNEHTHSAVISAVFPFGSCGKMCHTFPRSVVSHWLRRVAAAVVGPPGLLVARFDTNCGHAKATAILIQCLILLRICVQAEQANKLEMSRMLCCLAIWRTQFARCNSFDSRNQIKHTNIIRQIPYKNIENAPYDCSTANAKQPRL